MAHPRHCRTSKNIDWTRIPANAPVYDCGQFYVAGRGKAAAVVFWDGQTAATAQAQLRARARRTANAGVARGRRTTSRSA